jgi:hypothetical protein
MSTGRLYLWSRDDNTVLVGDDNQLEPPVIDVPPSSRATLLARQWCERMHIQAHVLATIGGLGRRHGSVDWGIWIRVDERAPGWRRAQLSRVASNVADARTRRLAGVLAALIESQDGERWIAHDPDWPERIRAWISRTRTLAGVGALVPLRSDVTTLVTKCSASDHHVYFTARPRPFVEPELADVLEAHSPLAFPRTLAEDPNRGWWLTDDVGGYDALEYVRRGDETALRLSRLMLAMANVQIATIGSKDVERLSFDITRESIRGAVARSLNAIRDDVRWTNAQSRVLLNGSDRLWDESGAEHVPRGWIHSDPAPENVRVVDRGAVVFIDLEDPWHGPILLLGALAIHSLIRRGSWSASTIGDHAWTQYLDACNLDPRRHQLETWHRLAQLVRLLRRVDRSSVGPRLLLDEETPRRSFAIADGLSRLLHHACGDSAPSLFAHRGTAIGSECD